MKKILFIVVGIIIFIVVGIIIAIPVSNTYAAKETAKQIADTPLPEQTEYIESVYLAGKLTGNGNGMQYFGAILIKSELSMDELVVYYHSFSDNSWEYLVEKQENEKIQVIEHEQLSFKTNIEGDNYYIVYSWGENNGFLSEFDIFDLRGH